MRQGNAIAGGLVALPVSLAMWAVIAAVPIIGIPFLIGWMVWEVRRTLGGFAFDNRVPGPHTDPVTERAWYDGRAR